MARKPMTLSETLVGRRLPALPGSRDDFLASFVRADGTCGGRMAPVERWQAAGFRKLRSEGIIAQSHGLWFVRDHRIADAIEARDRVLRIHDERAAWARDLQRARNPEPSLPVLWHGTSSLYLEQIMSQGLRPETSCYGHVCLSSDKDRASWFGREMARFEKAEFVLLQIDPAKLDRSAFCHEMGWIGNSLTKDEAQIYLEAPALKMLEELKVIGYRQVIQPEAFAIHEDAPTPCP